MIFKDYLLQRLQNIDTGSLSNGLTKADIEKMISKLSVFDAVGFDEIEDFDFEKMPNTLTEKKPDTENTLQQIITGLLGIDQIKDAVDADGDGKVTDAEGQEFFKTVMQKDGTAGDLTMEDIDAAIQSFGIDLEKIAEEAVDDAVIKIDDPEAVDESKAVDKTPATHNTSGGNYGNFGGGNTTAGKVTKPKTAAETVEELEKQKQEIISKADSDIQAKESEKDKAVNDSTKVSTELKQEYSDAKTALNQANSDISAKETEIGGFESDIAVSEQDIAALEGEKSTLSVNTDDEEINAQNQSRLSAIAGEISSKKALKAELEGKLAEAKQKLTELQTEKTNKEAKIAEVEGKIATADPELKTKIDGYNAEINQLKTQKTSDVSEIDTKIRTKRTEALKESKEAGESKGKAANNIGSGLIELAAGYMGLKESDGTYKLFTNGRSEAWCADFVTYVVKEYAQKQGMTVADGFGSPAVANLKGWAENNGVYKDITGMSSDEKEEFLESDLKPGDVIIWKRNGMSHTGFIKSINDDGTFETIEGNTQDAVRSNHKSVDSKQLSGFIRLQDIIS